MCTDGSGLCFLLSRGLWTSGVCVAVRPIMESGLIEGWRRGVRVVDGPRLAASGVRELEHRQIV